MLNLHNNTLTYILIFAAAAIVLGIAWYFVRKYQIRGQLARPMNTARTLQQMEAQYNVNLHVSQHIRQHAPSHRNLSNSNVAPAD